MRSELAETEGEQRTPLYKLLSRVFAYPDEGRIIEIAELARELSLAAPLRAGLQVPLIELQAEYTRLFINGYPELPCPPYESAYREGQLLGDAAERVQRFYDRWGLEAAGELPDHLALELEFVYFLELQARETRDPEVAAQARADRVRFLSEHLLKWVPRFAADLQHVAELDFYRQAGRLLAWLLSSDRNGSPSLPTDPDQPSP